MAPNVEPATLRVGVSGQFAANGGGKQLGTGFRIGARFARRRKSMAETTTADRAGHHHSLRDWSGWDYVPGLALIVIGILALAEPPITSLAAAFYLGVMLCVAGGFVLAGGFARMRHRGGWLGVLTGLLCLAAGLMVLYNPVAGAVSLVWVMGAWFIAGGIFELAIAFTIPIGKGWLIFVGIVDLVLGAYVLMMNPAQAFTFLGFLVGISLLFRGMWSLFFTADLHRTARWSETASG
jgi:uncharacterized membrane protein HdeD (DUF308 family)